MKQQVSSVKELIDADKLCELEWGEFDDALWLLLIEKIHSPADLQSYPPEVAVYYATRFLQWEVANGGFAQAAYNIPEWFALAADGYEAFNKHKSAQLIREAMKLLPGEREALERKGLFAATIDQVFAHFRESQMATFDDRIPDDEWDIDEERVRYVRQHADAFSAVDEVTARANENTKDEGWVA